MSDLGAHGNSGQTTVDVSVAKTKTNFEAFLEKTLVTQKNVQQFSEIKHEDKFCDFDWHEFIREISLGCSRCKLLQPFFIWMLEEGKEILNRHQNLSQSLVGIRKQQRDYNDFFTVAKLHLQESESLLQDETLVPSLFPSLCADAACLDAKTIEILQFHLTRFRHQLYHTNDRLNDTAQCYSFLDMAYEWALSAMKVLSEMKSQQTITADQVEEALNAVNQHLQHFPPLPEDIFVKMTNLAIKLNNVTLLQQCKMAQVRFQETSQMMFERQEHLLRTKRHLELCQCPGLADEREGITEPECSASASVSASDVRGKPSGHLPVSRCASFDTDDDSDFSECSSPINSKSTLEPRNSLNDIKEDQETFGDHQKVSSSCAAPEGCCWHVSNISSDNLGNYKMKGGDALSVTSEVNSHLLLRGSQLNLSCSEDATLEQMKTNKTLLLIMKELIHTEKDYVKSLQYIIENYIPELLREDIPQGLRGHRNSIFGNIEKICEFHSSYFVDALEACESRPFSVGSAFLQYENQFYLYALYNKNKPNSDCLLSEFGSFFKEKQLQLKDRMNLASYLLKPVQRMGKYSLLLKQLVKESSACEEGREDLVNAHEMVQFQLRHGNDLLAMDSLRDCDVNLKEQGRLLRQGEFLVWEGRKGKRTIRHVFLFEDLILFSKSRKDTDRKSLDIFQYKHSIKTVDMGLTEQVCNSLTKFEIWFRKRKPSDTYTLQAPKAEIKELWTMEISRLLWRQALRNRSVRLHEMSCMGIGSKPCLDIQPSVDQISDRSISISQFSKAPLLLRSLNVVAEESFASRPHSIVSMTSSSSSSSCGSVRPLLRRSITRISQCSTESGIVADMFENEETENGRHRVLLRTSSSPDSNSSPQNVTISSHTSAKVESKVFKTSESNLNATQHNP